MMKNRLIVILLVFTLFSLIAMTPSPHDDTIKIGIVDSLTGPNSAYGLASLDGY